MFLIARKQAQLPQTKNCLNSLLTSYLIVKKYTYLAGFLKTLSPNGSFASNSLFRPKTISKVVIIKTKSATIAFFSSPPFVLLALYFSPFLFLRYCDFEASRAQQTCLLTQMTANFVRLVFKKWARYIIFLISETTTQSCPQVS